MTAQTDWSLPSPTPFQGPARCLGCAGAKVTGERYTFDPSNGTAPKRMIVDVVCPVCNGCGRADHDTCTATDHLADGDHDDDHDWDDDEEVDETNGEVCFSCSGRRFWVCQGFDDHTVRNLLVPCGCATELLVQVGAGDG